MQHVLVSVLIFCIASSQVFGIGHSQRIFDVLKYGAAGDGQTDDSQAFVKAWGDLCATAEDNDVPTLLVPEKKTFLLQPVKFDGPCKSESVHVQILGNLVAPETPDVWKDCQAGTWLQFSTVSNLILDGSGQIDGQGSSWWKIADQFDILSFNDSLVDKNNCQRPNALYFHRCDNLKLSGLTHLNSPKAHISINYCKNVHVSHLTIRAPEDSPNTDGIDISASTNVKIQDSFMGTGDDCIAINGGCSNLTITNIVCGPGHGISVGSLGAHGSHEEVEKVYVKNCSFSGTQNGARIKTWQGGSGYARNIIFENIKLDSARNPIIIDQYYGNDHRSKSQTSAVWVGDVRYSDFEGTSADEEAIKFDCDQVSGCHNIVMDHINIISAVPGKKIFASCNNAMGTYTGTTVPNVPCLKVGAEPTTPVPVPHTPEVAPPPPEEIPPPPPPPEEVPPAAPPPEEVPPPTEEVPPPPDAVPPTPNAGPPSPDAVPPAPIVVILPPVEVPPTPVEVPPTPVEVPVLPPPVPDLPPPVPILPPLVPVLPPPVPVLPPPVPVLPPSTSFLPPPMAYLPPPATFPSPPMVVPDTPAEEPKVDYTGVPGVVPDIYFTGGATKLHNKYYIFYELIIAYLLHKYRIN